MTDLPLPARWYIASVIVVGMVLFGALLPRATLAPVGPLVGLVLLSSLFSAFKVQFPIASGSNMSLSYIVEIAAVIVRGPHATMVVAAASGLSQSTLNSRVRNPLYRTLFNMACLVLTAQGAGQVFQRLGGTPQVDPGRIAIPLAGTAFTYFVLNTVPIAVAIALTTRQNAWRIWKTDFASSGPTYLLGAVAAATVIAVTDIAGYWPTLVLAAAPLYLTYKVYRAGAATEARQGAILEAAHDAIVTMDQQLNIREFNPAAERMFGYRRMDILGRHVELLLPSWARPELMAQLEQYLATGAGPLAERQLEMNAVRASGSEFPVEVTVARVGADRSALITGFVRDISERRVLEERLRQSQKLEAIGRLAGGVAHDFNNILMSVLGSADLLLMQLGTEDPARGEVVEIKESVRRGASLTRQLLAFSRRQATSPRVFEAGDVIAGMDTMLRRLIGPEIELAVVRRARVTIRADPAQIEQVLLNLVINARDAMPEGGRITVTVEDIEIDEAAAVSDLERRPGVYARISVSDTGTGMDERTRARLFEPFFTTKEEGKGTGLGLSIVYGIVKQTGGHVGVTSECGRGTTFVIDLPAATTDARARVM